VSRSDLLKAFVRSDQEIIDELKDRVMRKVLWIDPDLVEIQCAEGNLVLSGHLETRSDAILLVELAGRLDGVVSVEDHLTWEIDNTKLEMVSPPPDPRRNWVSDN
ncbi:MAG TPA: BON domain-containing protein, partial [Acidimicrobiia bacterium]|nr:BON domain-containing protein [Acidimicrobiia bacterium]